MKTFVNILDMENKKINSLKILANKIRNHALDMTSRGSSSHIGSVFFNCGYFSLFIW